MKKDWNWAQGFRTGKLTLNAFFSQDESDFNALISDQLDSEQPQFQNFRFFNMKHRTFVPF